MVIAKTITTYKKFNLKMRTFRERNKHFSSNMLRNNKLCCQTYGYITKQLLGLGCNIISITVAMLPGLYVMGRQTERMRHTFNDFCCGCRSAKEEETAIHFLWQWPNLARCIYRLFGSPILARQTLYIVCTVHCTGIIHWCQGYMYVYKTLRLVIQRGIFML